MFDYKGYIQSANYEFFFNSITLTAVMAISELGVWEVCARLNINVVAALIGNNGTFYISILSSVVSFILLFVISAMLRKIKLMVR